MLRITINGRAYGPVDVRDDLTMNDFLRERLGLTGYSVRDVIRVAEGARLPS